MIKLSLLIIMLGQFPTVEQDGARWRILLKGQTYRSVKVTGYVANSACPGHGEPTKSELTLENRSYDPNKCYEILMRDGDDLVIRHFHKFFGDWYPLLGTRNLEIIKDDGTIRNYTLNCTEHKTVSPPERTMSERRREGTALNEGDSRLYGNPFKILDRDIQDEFDCRPGSTMDIEFDYLIPRRNIIDSMLHVTEYSNNLPHSWNITEYHDITLIADNQQDKWQHMKYLLKLEPTTNSIIVRFAKLDSEGTEIFWVKNVKVREHNKRGGNTP